MTIKLDHTIVPAKDKQAAAALFADVFGLTVKPDPGYFVQVQINESLTFDFADAEEFEDHASHHYAFHVSDEEFEGIWSRVKARGLGYGSPRTGGSTRTGADAASTSRARTTCSRS